MVRESEARIRMHLLYHFLPFLANFEMGTEWQIIATRDPRIELTRARCRRYDIKAEF